VAERTAGPLWTDLYELRMAASYLRHGMVAPATFSLFVRHLPPGRGFLVAAGLADALAFLEDLHFEPEELAWLGETVGLSAADLAALRELRFRGEVWAVPEGRIVFADEPLVEVTAPLPEAQLVETYLLNQVTFQTAIASKAARVRIAARGRTVVDFSFRRTQGPEAGIAVARACGIVGFEGTSNVEAARRYGLRPVGTMAHSYVQAFPGEEAAFRAFARDFPAATTFLVDTFDTLDGVRAAIRTIEQLGLGSGVAIRLDSGDLDALSRMARALLDAAGHPEVTILASGGLDEYAVDELVRSGAPINAFGVGTKMGVSADAPYLDTVYKLVEYDGRPIMKLSPGKATEPGRKQVFRSARLEDDLVGLRSETWPGRVELLRPVMVEGRRLEPVETPAEATAAARARFQADLAALPAEAARIVEPVPPGIARTPRLAELTHRTRARLSGDRVARRSIRRP